MAQFGESSGTCTSTVCSTSKLLSFRRYFNNFVTSVVIINCIFLDDSTARFQRLQALFANPMTEINLLFYQSALQVFVHFNMFLQSEHPLIPVIHEQIVSFLTKLASKFLQVSAIKDANGDFTSLEYANEELQLPGSNNSKSNHV